MVFFFLLSYVSFSILPGVSMEPYYPVEPGDININS